MSRTFEALQRAERERQAESASLVRAPPPRAVHPPLTGHALTMPSAATQRAAIALDQSLRERTAGPAAPILFLSLTAATPVGRVVLDAAITVAVRSGLRPLVADCDFLSPCLHRLAGIARPRGVLDLLSGASCEVRQVGIAGDQGIVYMVPVGGASALGMERLDRLESWLTGEGAAYDRIFLVGPALGKAAGMPGTPAIASLANLAAGVVLAVPAGLRGSYPVPDVLPAPVGARMLGIIAMG